MNSLAFPLVCLWTLSSFATNGKYIRKPQNLIHLSTLESIRKSLLQSVEMRLVFLNQRHHFSNDTFDVGDEIRATK